MQVEQCPQCGAPAAPNESACGYCKAIFFVTSLAYLGGHNADSIAKYLKHYEALTNSDPNNVEGFVGLGLCYLQLSNFPLANKAFTATIELSPDIASSYYYLSLSQIAGRTLKTLNLKEVRSIEVNINTALGLEENPLYMLLHAMLKRDFYEANGMIVKSPSASEMLSKINNVEINKNEIDRLSNSVAVRNPSYFFESIRISET